MWVGIRRRVEHVLVTRGPLVIIGLVVLGLLAMLAGGWFYTHPSTSSVENRTQVVDFHGELHTSALVTNSQSIYPAGTRVRDEPVYYLSANPNLTIATTLTPNSGSGKANVSIRYLVRRVAKHHGKTFFSHTRVLGSTPPQTGTTHLNRTLDVSAFLNRTAAVQKRVGDAGQLTTTVIVNVHYQKGKVSGTKNVTASLQQQGDWYAFPSKSFSVTRYRSHVEQWPNPRNWWLIGGLLGTGVVLLAAGVVLIVRYRREYQNANPVWYRHQATKAAYAEWITEGSRPDEFPEPIAAVDTLAGLVDIAIDSDRRVVHDTDWGGFYVLDDAGTYLYTYKPSESLEQAETESASKFWEV